MSYKKISVNGRKIDEHRYIMEQYLGRKLTRNEVVHHINGDKSDNRIENLELMTRAEHSKLHGLGKPLCKEANEKSLEKRKGKPNLRDRKLSYEQAEEIRKLYNSGDYSQRQLAEMFNSNKMTIYKIIHNITYIF